MGQPKAVSLFSGCGGADLGLREAGFDVVFANDVSPYAGAIYQANFSGVDFRLADVTTIDKFPSADLLVGCYPCQGYSQGGVRKAASSVNYLYREFDRALRQIRPKAFIVENVRGMSFGPNRQLLNNQLVRFRLAGYKVKWQVLDAKDFGLAQTRRRIFIVGIRSDLGLSYDFPLPTHGPECAEPHRTQRDTISGLPAWPDDSYCKEPFHWYYLSRCRRRDWDEPSPCIVGHWRHVPLHPLSPPLVRIGPDKWRFGSDGEARRLSMRECARLQGFPDTFDFGDAHPRQRFLAVGNAVPAPLIRAIASAIPEIW